MKWLTTTSTYLALQRPAGPVSDTLQHQTNTWSCSQAMKRHEKGVALILSENAGKSLIDWKPISSGIIKAGFFSWHIKFTVIQTYAPTNDADSVEREVFYEQLQSVLSDTPKPNLLIFIEYMNAKVGKRATTNINAFGNEACGDMNEKGQFFMTFFKMNNLVISGSFFKQKDIHKLMWVSPDGWTKNQIDHVTVNNMFKWSLLNVRVKRRAGLASDHLYLLILSWNFQAAVIKRINAARIFQN